MQVTVIATGPSLTQADVDAALCGPVVACSDAALMTRGKEMAHVSADGPWWRRHPEWHKGSCRRFTCAPAYDRFDSELERVQGAPSGCNSALLGLIVAVQIFGATRVLLLGVDLKNPGDHFFGKHPEGLRPSDQRRFDIFQRQFDHYQPKGVEIINCSPNSALKAYPRMRLQDALLACPA